MHRLLRWRTCCQPISSPFLQTFVSPPATTIYSSTRYTSHSRHPFAKVLHMPTQISQITSWCAEGQLDPIKLALEEEMPSLPREKQLQYCGHSSPCTSVLCSFQVVIWARCAARKNQLHIVRYLWDTFLGLSGVKVPWESMWCAASRGDFLDA